MVEKLNAREELEAVQGWLAMQHEDLSYGLKSPEDGLNLWRAWMADKSLPEFCDQYEDATDAKTLIARIKKILGYCPWTRANKMAAAQLASDEASERIGFTMPGEV
jgi:hypothetical protein